MIEIFYLLTVRKNPTKSFGHIKGPQCVHVGSNTRHAMAMVHFYGAVELEFPYEVHLKRFGWFLNVVSSITYRHAMVKVIYTKYSKH